MKHGIRWVVGVSMGEEKSLRIDRRKTTRMDGLGRLSFRITMAIS